MIESPSTTTEVDDKRTYKRLIKLFSPLLKFFFRARAKGVENVPESGGVLLAANHYSLIDPILLAVFTKRPITFMAKSQLFTRPLTKGLMKALGCVAINRDGNDSQALRTVLRELKRGSVVAIFPQGKRFRGHEPRDVELKKGVGFMAAAARVPVVPVGLYTRGFYQFIFKRTRLSYGKPVGTERCLEGVAREDVSAVASKAVLDAICAEIEVAKTM